MSPTLIALIGSFLSSGLLVALITPFAARRTAAAAIAKSQAETKQISSATARAEIDQAVTMMRDQRDDARTRAEKAETRAEAAETRVDEMRAKFRDLEKRLEGVEAQLDDAHEQSELMAQQLTEERGLRIAAERRADAAEKQVVILTEHARRVDEWWQRHDAAYTHEPKDAPPRLIGLDP